MKDRNLKTKGLPAPRLQLRWTDGRGQWVCHYELVLPLGKFDIRRDLPNCRNGRLILEIGSTTRGSTREPCVDHITGKFVFDEPYRDGSHAKWDSAALGGIPIYCIAIDGTPIPKGESK